MEDFLVADKDLLVAEKCFLVAEKGSRRQEFAAACTGLTPDAMWLPQSIGLGRSGIWPKHLIMVTGNWIDT